MASPMDFKWENETGPIDTRSPLITALPPKKRKFGNFPSNIPTLTQHHDTGLHSALETPTRSAFDAFNTPDRQRLREPHNEKVLFHPKPASAIPAHIQNNAWTTPRTPASTVGDYSSGGETPNTPGQDSDVSNTPGTQIASKMGRLNTEDVRNKSPKKGFRESFSSMFRGSPSPTKEKESRRAYSTKAESRVMKRRSKNRKATQRDEYDSDDTQAGAITQQQGPGQVSFARQAGDFLHWVEAHPHLPGVISGWGQLLVNSLLGAVFFYIMSIVWQGVKADIDVETSRYEGEALREIALCNRQYMDNHCHDLRVPAMESACGNWEACMHRDARQIAKASVTARSFAHIFNSFVNEFSTKSMIFCALVLFGSFNLSNWVFSALRRNHQQHQFEQWQQSQQQSQQQQQQLQQQQSQFPQQPQFPQQNGFYPPTTPHRHHSEGFLDQAPYTQYQTLYTGRNGLDMDRGDRSEMKRLPAPPELEIEGKLAKKSPTKRRLWG